MPKKLFATAEDERVWRENRPAEIRAYLKAYKQRPEYRQYLKERRKLPAVMEYTKEYLNRPEVKERYKENRRNKWRERRKLLDAMTPGQRRTFLSNEKKIKLQKKREKIAIAAIEKQTKIINEIKARQEKTLTQKQQLEMEARQLQVERLTLEADRLNKSKVDRAVAKIISDREKRAFRYRSLFKSYTQRVQEAIDYYYQLIETEDAQAHANRYFKGESIMRLSKVA